ncbi:MAG: hypothetical protein ACK4PR_11180, partial [Gammaproteobacteria bacterium]
MPNPNDIQLDINGNQEQQVFIDNPNNTDQQFVCTTMGAQLIKLKEVYLNPSQEQLDAAVKVEQEKQQQAAAKNNAEVSNPVVELDPIEAWLDAQIEAYLAVSSMNERGCTYIKNKVNEVSDELDHVTVATSDADGKLISEKIRIRLKETLSIVYLAIIDNDKWPVSDIKTREQQQTERLTMLSKVIIRASYGICHQGIRNEIAGCLGGYGNTELVEVAGSFIKKCIKEFMHRALFSNWQPIFKSQLWPWLRNKVMPDEVKHMLTDELCHQLQDCIVKEFEANGKQPDNDEILQIQAFCNKDILEKMYCECIDDAFLHTLNGWLEEYWDGGKKEKTQPEQIQRMVAAVLAWFDSDFDVTNLAHRIKFDAVRRVFSALQKIERYALLINLSTQIPETLLNDINAMATDGAFIRFVQESDDENNARLLATLDDFDKAYAALHKASFVNEINNFFALWFSDNEASGFTETKGNLFYLLNKDIFLQAVRLSDEQLKAFLGQELQ